MVDFSKLPKHLDDDNRRRELLDIERKLVEHPFPPQLVIENTSVCNLTCIHCSHRELIRQRRHMSRPLYNKIVEEVGREMPNCEIWPTFYGEALIMGYKNELWDRLEYADQVGCTNLVLNSNGTLLDRWDNIERILDSPLKRFIISLDGLSKETFETIREKAKWDEVYPAVERLCAERIRRGQRYPAITAQFSVMPQNAHEVDAYRKYWHERGAEVKVRPMLEWTRTGTVRTDTIAHDREFRIACPWGNNTMAIQSGRQRRRPAPSTMRGASRSATCAISRSRKPGIGSVSSCARRTASIAGTTFLTSVRAAATGRWPALLTRRSR